MMMRTAVEEAVGPSVEEIQELIDKRRTFLREELAKLDLMGESVAPVARPKIPKVQSFKGWTIPQCAKQLILEAGHTLTSGQILREMVVRGWETKSKRPITVIHSGLSESPYIARVGKRWDVSQKGMNTEF